MAVVVSAMVELSSLMFDAVSPGIDFGGVMSLLMEEGVVMSGVGHVQVGLGSQCPFGATDEVV
eukprot:4009371-Ditylum_brightwellii.AAC.1